MVSVWLTDLTMVVLKYMWCGWYFTYSASLSSPLQLHLIILLLSMAFHAWLLNRISRLHRSLPAATNEADNWELILYWAEQTPFLPGPTELHYILGYTWQLYPQLSYFIGVVFPQEIKKRWRSLALCGFCDAAENVGLCGEKKNRNSESKELHCWIMSPLAPELLL